MAELVPNSDGCKRFEPNQFKKEKCKNCSKPWNEHRGVISDEHLQVFTKAVRQAAQNKQKAEEEAKQAVKAKQQAKKKSVQAVEDEWLFDGNTGEMPKQSFGAQAADDSDDDDCGFRMFTPDVQAQPMRPNEPKAPKIMNLIDFGESNSVPEEPPVSSKPAAEAHFGGPATSSSGPLSAVSSRAASMNEEDLQLEIQHLRQMLRDANEEKSIQVAMVQDEVNEKQQLVEELTRRSSEAEGTVQDLRRQLEEARAAAPPPHDSAEASHWRSEAERLQLQVDRTQGRAEELQAELDATLAAKAEAEAQRARSLEQFRQRPTSPTSPTSPSAHAEAHAVAQAMGRHAAQALREIRLNAELQLAWLSKRRLLDGQQHSEVTSQPRSIP